MFTLEKVWGSDTLRDEVVTSQTPSQDVRSQSRTRDIIAASRLMSVGQIESVEELLREVTTLLKVAPAVSLRPPTPE